MAEVTYHRIQCAAITRGCASALAFKSRTKTIDDEGLRLLKLNGWWLDHGLWVCGLHDKPAERTTDG